ncbi:hypothetical protein [Colwellia sp. C1TZA3]|uniref:hypothetical protein n=1 Tax=Colwellia sp. C1TZA3 TaxID=2508879 RepID=UPI001CB94469|nr:hypothetical protein [Colwellia sp. C1TZA3]
MTKLVARLKEKFTFAEQIDMSIEIDPREIEMNLAEHLYSLSFNRLIPISLIRWSTLYPGKTTQYKAFILIIPVPLSL